MCTHCGAIVDTGDRVCPGCGMDRPSADDSQYGYVPGLEEEDAKPAESRAWYRLVVPAVALALVCLFVAVTIPFGIYIAPVLVCAAGAGYYMASVYPKTQRGVLKRLEKEFLAVLHGDREQMERLVGYEMMRRPGLDRIATLRSAMDRLLRDRR